jgi:hypothetical protein
MALDDSVTRPVRIVRDQYEKTKRDVQYISTDEPTKPANGTPRGLDQYVLPASTAYASLEPFQKRILQQLETTNDVEPRTVEKP